MPRANLTPAAVTAAAAELADRSGLDAVTLSALARQFGVQPASLYSHVRDRSAVLDGIQLLAFAELAELVGDAVAGRSGRDALVGLADAERAYAHRSPGRWTAMQRPASVTTADSPAPARLTTLLFAVLRGYAIPDDELVHATRMLSACINGFVALEDAGAFAARQESVDESWRRCLGALDYILAAWTSSPPSWSAEEEQP